MILYIIRHAAAVEGSDTLQDEWRYLTEKGRLTAEKMSSSIAKIGPKPRLTISSPLTRSIQTAEIMAANACRKNVVVTSSLLLPGADVGQLIAHIKTCGDAKRVMLVGHEPQLGLLVARLSGREDKAITLKKGACVAFEFNPGKDYKPAVFNWYLEPGKKQKRIMSINKAFSQA